MPVTKYFHRNGVAIFGVASIRHGAKTPEALIDLADKALYNSKKTGRNRVTTWNEAMYHEE